MTVRPWWERYPGRLEQELAELEAARIVYAQDEPAFSKGVVRLRLRAPSGRETIELEATYPDLYPYFRVEVIAPHLALQHHQNPFLKNLCLLGRSSYNWDTTATLASLLKDRLDLVIQTGQSVDTDEITHLEEHQAEPWSDYLRYHEGAVVLLGGSFPVPRECSSGGFDLGLAAEPSNPLRAVLLAVHDEDGNTLSEPHMDIRRFWVAARASGRWVRMDGPPPSDNPGMIFDLCQDADPHRDKIVKNTLGDRIVQIRAALFPQEIRNWRESEYSWLFACRPEPTDSWKAQAKCRKKHDLRNKGRRH